MMIENDIDKLAQSRSGLPAGMDSFEQALYYSLCGLYDDYDKGTMPATIAAVKKKALIETYKDNKQKYAMIMDHCKRMNEINRILDEAEAAGDEYAAKIRRVFYGVQ